MWGFLLQSQVGKPLGLSVWEWSYSPNILIIFRIVCWGGDTVPDTCQPGVAGQAQADQPAQAGHQPQARQAEGAPGTN